MRLSALFEEFTEYLRVEREATPRTIATYRWCFHDYLAFARQEVGGTVLATQFTAEGCRAYQYSLSARSLQTNTIRVRLATLSSFGKWAVRRGRLPQNPLDLLTRPRRKSRLPAVPRRDVVERLIAEASSRRDAALLALMAYGGLRRSELVALNIGDFDPEFGLRRVLGKGDQEAAVPLPVVARDVVAQYLARDRSGEPTDAPMFIVCYRTVGGTRRVSRMADHRVWKVTRALGERAGLSGLHPHAFRHSCGTELLQLTGNLRAVQDHLRHADIQTTTVYTRLTRQDLQKAVSAFDQRGSTK